MKLIFLLLSFVFVQFSYGQILCVKCFQQNDSVYAGGINLIQNGGFENGCIGSEFFCPNSNFYTGCVITNWVCQGGGSETYAQIANHGSWTNVVEGISAAYFGNYFCGVCNDTIGDTMCLNNSDCIVTGIPIGYPLNDADYGGASGVSLIQTVTGLVFGSVYVLEFWAGGEYLNFQNQGVFAVDLGFGNVFLRNKETEDTVGIGTRYLIVFLASSSTHTFKFTNWGHICNNCTELVLDDVKLYSLIGTEAPCSIGINEPAQSSISLSPNPATTSLTITTTSNEKSEIIIYDLLSRKLIDQSFTNTITLNTASLAKGIYMYEVRDAKGIVGKGKVVIE